MKNIAIIGTGISGLTSAYLLSQKHNVSVFEQNDYIGGHTATVTVNVDGKDYDIDTGFIVFNDKTYPNFLKLLDRIGIKKQPTEMSFSVRNTLTGLEYNGHNLNTLFSQRRNLLNPKFWKLISQILKFNKLCKARYADGHFNDEETLGQFLTEHSFTEHFAEHYILPMGAAIWSSSIEQMEKFPLGFFIRFFFNHGLLNVADRPQWYVIPGGSKNYIPNLIANFKDNIELNSHIKSVSRQSNGVVIQFADGSEREFDEVVFTCHSDQALKLLADPNEQEQQILGGIPYTENEVVLHTDINMLPRKRLSWASWNYQLDGSRDKPAAVTYNMNILMGLQCQPTFCVTLNQTAAINEQHILRKFTYHHPVFNNDSFKAQQRRSEICGQQHTHFAGAYWYNGFHEDGVRSAVDVGKRFGITL
jgi:predicted NAD/FAD-binding protein